MSAFHEVCNAIGIAPRHTPADGKWYPTDTIDKAPGNGNGRVKRFADDTGGMVWNWTLSDADQCVTYFDDSEINLSPAEKKDRIRRSQEEWERADKELAEERSAAAKLAAQIWKVATPPVDSVYFSNKGVAPTETVREIDLVELVKLIGYHPAAKGKPFSGKMVQIIPVSNGANITTIEMIDETGLKAGLKNGQKKGCFWSTGKLPDCVGTGLTIGIGEGVATMLTYHAASNNISIAALSCGNLKAVALFFRNRYPAARIEIISDVGNGEQSAIAATRAVDGWLIKPGLADDSTGSDINDQHKESGLQSVKISIKAAKQIEPVEAPTPDNLTAATTSGDEWPEPLPLPEGLPPVKLLEPEMLPVPFRAWLMDIADRMQTPPDFSAAAAIVALGSVIGRGCGIYPKRHDDWLVVPNLWGAVVGRPSMMKTPAVSEGQRPLVRLETEAREEYQGTAKAFELDAEIMKITKAAHAEELKRALKKGDTGAVEAARGKLATLESNAPNRRRFQTQDGTTEKIGELLIENPRGALVNRDELIGWFRSLDKDGREGDRSFYLEAWNGNRSFTYDRIGRGTLDIPALCVSVFGAMTPGPLSTYVYQANRGGIGDDGLLQRFQVFVWPDAPTEWKNVDRFPDTKQKNRAWEIFKKLSGDIPGAQQTEGADIPALRFSPGGQDVFNNWRHELETRLNGNHGLPPSLESHLTKYRKLMPSLALIFHLAAVADGLTPGPVTEVSAVLAAAWCQYLESHAMRIYGAATMPGMEAARELVRHIRRGAIKTGATVREIWRHQWARLTTPEEVRAGLEVLEQYDWLSLEKTAPKEKGGRPSEIVRLNPRIKL
ncbi:MAG: DUF3987 domain-containing protein [Deltaproteobacteria bacterium]|nr:DUF3987 domain-containing protein [Deltaproteobacteria bacterium]TLN00910.1 MAG: DUF3987 domain-containing protein [bacterium]